MVFLWKKAPITALTKNSSTTVTGRNGHILTRHRFKPINGRRYRVLNKKPFFVSDTAQVLRIEYTPNQSAFIGLIRFIKSGLLSYTFVGENCKVGDLIYINPSLEKISSSGFILNLNKKQTMIGPLYSFPKGSIVSNISSKPFGGFSLCRGAGTYAKITGFSSTHKLVELLMPSGKTIYRSSLCFACSGQTSNSAHFLNKKTKASQNFYLGIRPTVRGVAMNPVDHPMGGGEGKSSGGRPSVSPWGKLTKGGFKTIKKNTVALQTKIKKIFNK